MLAIYIEPPLERKPSLAIGSSWSVAALGRLTISDLERTFDVAQHPFTMSGTTKVRTPCCARTDIRPEGRHPGCRRGLQAKGMKHAQGQK